jgi:hypothetical protein
MLKHFQSEFGDLVGKASEQAPDEWCHEIPILKSDHPYFYVSQAIETARNDDAETFAKSFVPDLKATHRANYFNLLKQVNLVESYHGILQDNGNCYVFHLTTRSADNPNLKLLFILKPQDKQWLISVISVGTIFSS